MDHETDTFIKDQENLLAADRLRGVHRDEFIRSLEDHQEFVLSKYLTDLTKSRSKTLIRDMLTEIVTVTWDKGSATCRSQEREREALERKVRRDQAMFLNKKRRRDFNLSVVCALVAVGLSFAAGILFGPILY